MEDFKRNRVKLLSLKDDVILFINQKDEDTYGVYSSEFTFIFRSGKRIKVTYITKDRIQFQAGMFSAFLGTKREELSQITYLEFAKELQDFGADCDYNTSIIFD